MRSEQVTLGQLELTFQCSDSWLEKALYKSNCPPYRAPFEAMVMREKTASSHLSLKAKIDQFQLKEDREEQGEPVIQVSDSREELDRSFPVHCHTRRWQFERRKGQNAIGQQE